MNYDRTLIGGNITRDPELRHTQGGMAICKFGVAVNRKSLNKSTGEVKESTCFIDCTAFGKTAENIKKYFTKGEPIFIEGRHEFSTWEDKQTGAKRSKLGVIVDRFEFVGGPNQGERSSGGQQRQEQQGEADYGDMPF